MALQVTNLVGFGPGNQVTPGSQSFTTSGSHNFVVPQHNVLTIELWGGGGPGGTATTTASTSGIHVTSDYGGASTISSLGLTANGGGPGQRWREGSGGGAGGTATGGDTNTTGNAGGTGGTYYANGFGAAAPSGGGAQRDAPTGDAYGLIGNAPGGGGSGGAYQSAGTNGGGGGAGGYLRKAYPDGVLAPGTTLSITVGDGGIPATGSSYFYGGYGAVGRCTISWL